ncbi:hypothetical protein FisN_17Lh201 [Fistulifera solaris]|uniref:C3H1-type domain-containing protein n=1 Tax=Fistulifera solaris TaxID=1519565 RepID=A0A1Z5JDD2_FISSO|nr:hypothetical protein FisN_17Lh201 [Fistulifera solaris]|eukprot:GAX11892.1 hypothetical protein FisN_17Lh201 [Fistulifera solaris]
MDDSALRVNFIQAIVANEQRRNRTEQVSGLRLGREQDIALFPLEDLHRDPLLQDYIRLGAQPLLERNEGLMELENEQHDTNAEANRGFGGEGQANNEPMEADEDIDEEMRNMHVDQEAEWSDKYPIVSSPGSSHSSSRFTPVFETKVQDKCYVKLESDELERIEMSICLAEEKELIKTLDDLLCRAEEKHLLKNLETRIVNVEKEVEKLRGEETEYSMIRAQLKVPRLLPGSKKEFVTSEFLTECTTNFRQKCAAIKKETKLKTTLTDVKGSPQTWLLNAEGPKEAVRLFFVHWGKEFRRRVTSHTIQQLLLKGIEITLKLDATQSLGVRVDSCNNQSGLLVLKKEDGYKGQLADVVSPQNLAFGAIILQADGASCKSVEELKILIKDVRKRGAKEIQIKFCLARTVDFNRIDHTAVVSLPVDRSNGKTISLPQVARRLRLKSVRNQQQTSSKDPEDEEWVPEGLAAQPQLAAPSSADTSPTFSDSRKKKRKEDDIATDEALQQKRVRNDQNDSSDGRLSRSVGESSKKKIQSVDEGGKHNLNERSSSRSGLYVRSGQPPAKSIGDDEQRTTKPLNKNDGLSQCVKVVNKLRNTELEQAVTLTSSTKYGVRYKPLDLPRPASNVGYPAQMSPVNATSEQRTTKSLRNNGGLTACVSPKRPLSRVTEQFKTLISRTEYVAGKGTTVSVGFARTPSLNGDGKVNAHETSTQSRNGLQSKKRFGGGGETTAKSMDTNGGLNRSVFSWEVGNSKDDLLLEKSPSRNTEPGEASTMRSRIEQAAREEVAGQSASDNSTNRISCQAFNQACPESRGVNSSSMPQQAAAQAATTDMQTVGNSSCSDGISMTQSPQVSERTRSETSPPKGSAIIDTHANIHIDTDDQEVFKTKFDPGLSLGFYCIYDSVSKACRVVSVCKTGQASKDRRIQPGTKLIGIFFEKLEISDLTDEYPGPPPHINEVDEGSSVRHIWCPQDLKTHMTAARKKELPAEVWFANDSDNPYFNSFKSRFREAQWGDEGEWRGPNFAGWDGVLEPKDNEAKKKSDGVLQPEDDKAKKKSDRSRMVEFSGKDSTHIFFRTENMTSESNGKNHRTNEACTISTSSLKFRFKTLEDAISRGTVSDLIEYIFPFGRSEMRDGLTQRHFSNARSMTRANAPSDVEMKDKLLKICARTLRAINLVRAFPFWEKFDIHVFSIRSLRLPHSIKHRNCYVYLEAEQVSASDTAPLPSSQSFLWNPTAIEISDLFYSISFNKYIETNRTIKIRVMARPTSAGTAVLLGTVDVTEADLSVFTANGESTDYSRTLSTIVGEPFFLDFRVVRTSTPEERRKKDQAIKYIHEGLNSIQTFNKDLGESSEVNLSLDMHSTNEDHLTLLHAAIAMYDGPTLEKALAAGANPFYKTPYCSPFDMAQHMSGQLADAKEIDRQRKSVIEQMILLMNECGRGQDVNYAEETGRVSDPLYGVLPSIDGRMRTEEESMTEHITPILDHPKWLDIRVRQPQLCRYFEKSQRCPRHGNCHFIHRYRSFGENLNLILEKSCNHIVPDHDTSCCVFLEEKSSTGQVWFTSGYLSNSNTREKQIFYAEGGQDGVPSSQNVWWYPKKASALFALQRVMAAHDWAAQQKKVPVQHHQKKFVDMEIVANTWSNLSKRKKGHCRYWPRCKDNDQKCRYFHGYGPFHQSSDKNVRANDQHHDSSDAPYDVRFHTSKDLREGRLYYTARYRLSSDNALRYVPDYNGEGFFDQKNELFWFESEEKVHEAIASSK